MLKAVLAAATALTVAGSAVAYAQPGDRPRDQRRFQANPEDVQAFQAARLAALRAGLMLNADQEKHWPAFETAAREFQQLRLDRINARREARRDDRQKADPVDRMRRKAARMGETGAALKKLADATDPLYQSLDDAQRRRFAILSRMTGPRGHHRGKHWRRHHGGDQHAPRQRRTEAAPGNNLEALAGEILPIVASRESTVGTPSMELTRSRTAADAAPAELGLARTPISISYKSTGFNWKPYGFNQKLANESF